MSRCLSPHGTKRHPVTIHPHDDGSWWCWSPGGIEQGPFNSQGEAEEVYQSIVEQISQQQSQLPQRPVSNWPFYETALIELLIAFLFVFVCWLIDHQR